MLQFSFVSNDVVMTYDGDSGEQIIWVWESLNKFQTVCISRIFNFQLQDLRNPPSTVQDFNDYEYSFNFGTLNNEYITVPGRILRLIEMSLYISPSSLKGKYLRQNATSPFLVGFQNYSITLIPSSSEEISRKLYQKAYSRSCKVNSPTQGTGSLC